MRCKFNLCLFFPSLALTLLSCNVSAAKVIAYPRPAIDAPSEDFSLEAEGVAVDCIDTVMRVGYAHFSFSGRVRVELTASEPIETYDLSPHRLEIDAKVNGNRLTFWLDRPCKLHLRINQLPRFFIFADRLEKHAPDAATKNTYLLTDFDVTSSPMIVQTEKIQRAIDVAASHRSTLVVPQGVYLSGTLNLPSNLTLYLQPGAIIRGTTRLSDYPRAPGGLAQLRLADAENVHIRGRGVIDNNGLAMRTQFLPDRKRGRVKMLVAQRCRDIVVEDVILRDSGVWCIHPFESGDLQFRNLKIISVSRAETGPGTSHNTDGFDPDNSSNILIEDNFISVDDDAIAVKLANGHRRDMSDVVFRDNVVWTTCAALKIGTEVFGHTARNIVFQGNDVIHADSGIVVQCYRGGYVDGARWIDNHFEQIGLVPNNSPHRKGLDFYVNSGSKESFGEIRNVLLSRNVFERSNSRRSMIRGAGAAHVVDGVVIDRLQIAGEAADSLESARLHVDRDVQNVEFR